MKSAHAPIGLAFDTSQKVTEANATAMRQAGYLAAGRYVRLPGNNPASDIDAGELEMLTGCGFAVWLVQHPRMPGWRIAECSGVLDGETAASHAKDAGYPASAVVYVDLEGIDGNATATTMYVDAWSMAVREAGYQAGVYCGFDNPLDAEALWALKLVNTYWSDAAYRVVAHRGCAIRQRAQTEFAGMPIDPDVIAPDLLGELPSFAVSG